MCGVKIFLLVVTQHMVRIPGSSLSTMLELLLQPCPDRFAILGNSIIELVQYLVGIRQIVIRITTIGVSWMACSGISGFLSFVSYPFQEFYAVLDIFLDLNGKGRFSIDHTHYAAALIGTRNDDLHWICSGAEYPANFGDILNLIEDLYGEKTP